MNVRDNRMTLALAVDRFESGAADAAFLFLGSVDGGELLGRNLEDGAPDGVARLRNDRWERTFPLPVGVRENKPSKRMDRVGL